MTKDVREDVIRAVAALSGLNGPNFERDIEIENRHYRIEELPTDPVELEEFFQAVVRRSNLLALQIAGQAKI